MDIAAMERQRSLCQRQEWIAPQISHTGQSTTIFRQTSSPTTLLHHQRKDLSADGVQQKSYQSQRCRSSRTPSVGFEDVQLSEKFGVSREGQWQGSLGINSGMSSSDGVISFVSLHMHRSSSPFSSTRTVLSRRAAPPSKGISAHNRRLILSRPSF